MVDVSTQLERLSRETRRPEAEVVALAIEAGLRHLWREHVLGRYLRGELPREEAIAAVGAHWVELAERERQAVIEDLTWALES